MKAFITYIILILTVLGYNSSADAGYENLKPILSVNKSSFEIGEPIIVRFKLLNTAHETVNLKLSKKPYFNFSFHIKSIKNQIIKEKNYFYFQKINANQQNNTPNRVIALSYNELYGKSFDLTKYYELYKPGYYLIQGLFKPMPGQVNAVDKKIETQIIQIEIRNSPYEEQVRIQTELEQYKEIQKIRTPSSTINFILESRIQKKWTQYFTYIDLQRLIKQYPKFLKEYTGLKRSQSYHRQKVLESFKDYLKRYLSEIGLLTIDSFNVYKTVIENEKKKARVFARIKYKDNKIIFNRQYTFYLYQKNQRWYVYSWKINNI